MFTAEAKRVANAKIEAFRKLSLLKKFILVAFSLGFVGSCIGSFIFDSLAGNRSQWFYLLAIPIFVVSDALGNDALKNALRECERLKSRVDVLESEESRQS